MKKIERLISIVMILLQKEIISASEFSRLFNVSKRTIQRDMEALSYANIPIYAQHGAEGGYALMAGYKFDKRLVNHHDLENILISLAGYDQLITNPNIQMTIQKIKAMSKAHTPSKLNLTFYEWSGRDEIKEDIAFMHQAIEQHWLLKFDYIDQVGQRTCRIVEPYKLQFIERHWYLVAYSRERNDYRTFKLTRMLDIQKAGFFKPRSEEDLMKSNGKAEKLDLVTVQLLIDARVRDQFIERYGKKSVTEVTIHQYLANIELPESPFSYQFLAGLGNMVKILSPQHFIDNYLEFLREAIASYD